MNILLKSGRLLDEHGSLKACGFNFELVREYRKTDVRDQNRTKEWDTYYIYNDKYSLTLSARNLSFYSELFISFIDFDTKTCINKSYKKKQASTLVMPTHSKIGSVEWELKNFSIEFYNYGYSRKLICAAKKFTKEKDFYCVIDLNETTNGTTVHALPFEDKFNFYYTQKINCQKATGYFTIGEDKYELPSESRCTLDFVRSVWPKKEVEFSWASMSTIFEDKEIGFNIMNGFSDLSSGAITMFMYDKHAYKLDSVNIISPISPSNEWIIKSDDNQVDLKFIPFVENENNSKGFRYNISSKILYGKVSGYIMFDKDKIEFNDLISFIETNKNTW